MRFTPQYKASLRLPRWGRWGAMVVGPEDRFHTLFPFFSPHTMATAVTTLVSVNTAPDRAKKVIGAMIEMVKDRYTIVHAGNAEGEYMLERGITPC